MTSWAATLDAFEARLDAQRTALDAGGAGSIAPFCPPTGLGPLTPDLAPRARELLDQALDLEDELAGNVQSLAVDLSVVRTMTASTSRPQHAHFVDFSA